MSGPINIHVFGRIYPLPRDKLTLSKMLSTAVSGSFKERNDIILELDNEFKPAFDLIYSYIIDQNSSRNIPYPQVLFDALQLADYLDTNVIDKVAEVALWNNLIPSDVVIANSKWYENIPNLKFAALVSLLKSNRIDVPWVEKYFELYRKELILTATYSPWVNVLLQVAREIILNGDLNNSLAKFSIHKFIQKGYPNGTEDGIILRVVRFPSESGSILGLQIPPLNIHPKDIEEYIRSNYNVDFINGNYRVCKTPLIANIPWNSTYSTWEYGKCELGSRPINFYDSILDKKPVWTSSNFLAYVPENFTGEYIVTKKFTLFPSLNAVVI